MSQLKPNDSAIRVAVITDLHYVSDQNTSTRSFRPQAVLGGQLDSMEKLTDLIASKGITSDWLLCPGDITTYADENAFMEGWSKLRNLKTVIKARHLVAATGNHEVQSRASEKMKEIGLPLLTVDPVGHLQTIKDYPTEFSDTPEKRWIYWGRGYEIIEENDTVIVLVNSCHFHVTMQPNEYERGKISDLVLNDFREKIAAIASSKKFRIVLMHHHPIAHPDVGGNLGQIDMHNGIKLMEILEQSFHDWIVIHGHKHHPRLIRAQGATSQPVVFSAGSFGAALNGALATKTKNQFYILTLEAYLNASGVYQMRGKIEAYYWSSTEWREATERDQGIPYGCGFSSNIDIDELASEIVSRLKDSAGTYLKWSELCSTIPMLLYLTPSEIDHLRFILPKLAIHIGGDSRLWFPTELSL